MSKVKVVRPHNAKARSAPIVTYETTTFKLGGNWQHCPKLMMHSGSVLADTVNLQSRPQNDLFVSSRT